MVRSTVISLFVCLSTQKPHDRTSHTFLHGPVFTHVACGPGSVLLGGVAICDILSFLWMTSCFHTKRPVSQNQARRYV